MHTFRWKDKYMFSKEKKGYIYIYIYLCGVDKGDPSFWKKHTKSIHEIKIKIHEIKIKINKPEKRITKIILMNSRWFFL